jgi:hypothetical protein
MQVISVEQDTLDIVTESGSATTADKETVNRRSLWFGAGTTVNLGTTVPAGRRRG